jgi:hypothetical protein
MHRERRASGYGTATRRATPRRHRGAGRVRVAAHRAKDRVCGAGLAVGYTEARTAAVHPMETKTRGSTGSTRVRLSPNYGRGALCSESIERTWVRNLRAAVKAPATLPPPQSGRRRSCGG